ncbi:hypothetical protein KPL78_08800, partial [Roseomonas sp. HJA6]|nr:hypothetical protein [Neoroseomonas alba]
GGPSVTARSASQPLPISQRTATSRADQIVKPASQQGCRKCPGDLANAGYWYRRAGRPAARGTLAEEWDAILTALAA